MKCPACGFELPHLATLLSQTQTGTQCPNCWTRLRALAPPPPLPVRTKPVERPAAHLRRAA